jgi:iron complex outermembrane receptor protein
MKRILGFVALALVCMHAGAQFSASGKVQDSNGEKLVGANVLIEGSQIATSTDVEGRFELREIKAQSVKLLVSFTGYENYVETINLSNNQTLDIVLKQTVTNVEEVVVSTLRAQKNTPTTYSFISKKEITKVNLGQDAPYMLALEPSVTTTSDGGTGIGYTGMRIRGTESSKINVTINGIPFNDAESHGVFWVDVPDVASSAQSIQIQRGVGSSTNGSGAYGGSINLQTDNVSQQPFFEYSGSAGSFNTLKNSLHFATGLINSHWFLEGKVSGLKSDGYIDRSWSNLKSYFGQTGYYSENTIVKLVAFGGWEETYQAWYGLDSATMYDPNYGRTYNWAGAYTDKDGSTKFYKNFIDHYQQDHFQLHFIHKFNNQLSANAALHYTNGRGFYEEYKENKNLSDYGMPDLITEHDTIRSTNLVRRLWLDNNFYGGIWGLTYMANNLSIVWGGGVNKYGNAQHFGEVVWAEVYTASEPNKEYYRNVSNKTDFNSFVKVNYNILSNLSLFADVQGRFIGYSAKGPEKSLNFNINEKYNFFNPKAGLIYQVLPKTNIYASIAIANREPNRDDFKAAMEYGITKPTPETLYDFEFGARHHYDNLGVEVVFYNMQYVDQLVLTGAINDVGAYIRKNIGRSYRRGVELQASIQPHKYLKFDGNITLSDNQGQTDTTGVHKKTAFSPSLISGLKLSVFPVNNLELSFVNKFVGEQYMDNTEMQIAKLDSYNVLDFLASYSIKLNKIGMISLNARVINLLDKMYVSNGYVDGTPYYFPQAGRNFLIGVNIRF